MSFLSRLRKLERLRVDKCNCTTAVVFQEIQPNLAIAPTAVRLDLLTGQQTEVVLTLDELEEANKKLVQQFAEKNG